jgi:hypothetical protein
MEVWWDDIASAASGERSMVTDAGSVETGAEIWPMFFLPLSAKVNGTDSNEA